MRQQFPVGQDAPCRWRWLPWGLAALALWGVVRSAWLCDDAFITLRTVDNFVNGFGLTWNVDERVQAYTHPLWMLLLSGLYALTREPFYTTIFTSLALTALFLALFVRLHARAPVPGSIALGALAVSKSLADFSTSGLEGPLTHLLLCAALWLHLDGPKTTRRLGWHALVAALGAVNRLDSILLFLPLLAASAWRMARDVGWRRIAAPLAVGGLPFLAWEVFSLFYYGSAVPNTAHAKLATGVAMADYLRQGLEYFLCSAIVDPVPFVAILAAVTVVLTRRRWDLWPVVAAIALGLVYVLRIGGDFMVGRHLAAPLVAAAVLLARIEIPRRPALVLGAAWLAYGLLPHSPLLTGPEYTAVHFKLWFSEPPRFTRGIGDERGRYYPTLGLWNAPGRDSSVATSWADEGRKVRHEIEAEGSSRRVIERSTIGLFGFYAGPRAVIVDRLGLADPLLARLPTANPKAWRIGHFVRQVPQGYMATRETGTNVIEDQDLSRYYDRLREVVAGELWSLSRLRTLLALNAGRFEPLMKAYVARSGPPK